MRIYATRTTSWTSLARSRNKVTSRRHMEVLQMFGLGFGKMRVIGIRFGRILTSFRRPMTGAACGRLNHVYRTTCIFLFSQNKNVRLTPIRYDFTYAAARPCTRIAHQDVGGHTKGSGARNRADTDRARADRLLFGPAADGDKEMCPTLLRRHLLLQILQLSL